MLRDLEVALRLTDDCLTPQTTPTTISLSAESSASTIGTAEVSQAGQVLEEHQVIDGDATVRPIVTQPECCSTNFTGFHSPTTHVSGGSNIGLNASQSTSQQHTPA